MQIRNSTIDFLVFTKDAGEDSIEVRVLDAFAKRGYVLDKNRLMNGQIFDEDYFEHLISEIQEIRASERRFYQKITDIYATAVDYSVDSQITRDFLQQCRTRCILLFMEILRQKLSLPAQIIKRRVWD